MDASNIVELLEAPTVQGVMQLRISVALDEALAVCTSGEAYLAEEAGDDQWFANRQVEYNARRLDLADKLGNAGSGEVALGIIKDWHKANSYVRPIDQDVLANAQQKYAEAKQHFDECTAVIKELHRQDRFGWNHQEDREDMKYSQADQALAVAQQAFEAARKNLRLAEIGVKQQQAKTH